MTTFLSKEVQLGLDKARLAALKRASRLRVMQGDATYPVLRMWKTGFTVEAETAPYLRGHVDLYDGAVHLFTCLIVASDQADGEMSYEFKRATAVSDAAALDFEKSVDAPVALLARATP